MYFKDKKTKNLSEQQNDENNLSAELKENGDNLQSGKEFNIEDPNIEKHIDEKLENISEDFEISKDKLGGQ